jgi:hypothetical protein
MRTMEDSDFFLLKTAAAARDQPVNSKHRVCAVYNWGPIYNVCRYHKE